MQESDLKEKLARLFDLLELVVEYGRWCTPRDEMDEWMHENAGFPGQVMMIYKTCRSAAGYYPGYWCDGCGPNDRLSLGYYKTGEEVDRLIRLELESFLDYVRAQRLT